MSDGRLQAFRGEPRPYIECEVIQPWPVSPSLPEKQRGSGWLKRPIPIGLERLLIWQYVVTPTCRPHRPEHPQCRESRWRSAASSACPCTPTFENTALR